MAYAAVLSLKQTIKDYVLPFQLLNLEIRKLQVSDLCSAASEVVGLLRQTPVLSESRLIQLAKDIDPVLITNVDAFVEAVGSERLQNIVPRIFGISPEKSPMGKPNISQEITDLKSKLQSMRTHVDTFLRETIFFYIWEDSSFASARRHSKTLVYRLRDAIEERERAISIFQREVGETISLQDKVCKLLLILMDTNDHELVCHIKDVTDRAGESIQDWLTGNPVVLEMKNFLESPIKDVHLESTATKLYNNVTLIHSWVKRTMEAVSSRDFQSGIASNRVLLRESSSEEEDGDLSPKFVQSQADTLREPYGEKNQNVDISFRNLRLRGASDLKSSLKSPLKQEGVVVGLEVEMNAIIDKLTRPSSGRQVHTIVGMGGIGKTTLAKKIFHHPRIVYHFHCLAWVDRASKTDQVREMLLNLLYSLAPSNDKSQGNSIEDLGENLRKILKGRKYLIVFDDLWNVEAWKAINIYFPDDKNGSRILITTRFTEFPTDAIHKMRLLNKEQSWELLEMLVYGVRSCPAVLVYLGKQIAEKCGGLPLAIVVIAGTLSRIKSTPDCWRDVAKSVNSIVCTDPQQCLDILAVSYNLLPHNLKACFLHMGAFPAYTEIPVWKIISLWIAEGFLDLESSKNLEGMAEQYLEDLIARSLVLVAKRTFGGKIKTCLIHDLLRELCLREAQKANFMCVLETQTQGFPAGIDKQHRLVFNLDNCADMQLLPSVLHLRSFMWLTLGSDFVPGILGVQLPGFKLLRVLDMFFLQFDAFPVLLLTLVNLRYLALNVTYEFDASMSELWRLESLIIYGPWSSMDSEGILTLPLEYWSMPWLRHLHMSVPSHLRNPSVGAQDFGQPLAPQYLQTLSTITFSSCSKEIFSIMPHLKNVGISETKEEYITDRSSACLQNLAYLQELEILKCSFYSGNSKARSLCLSALPSSLKELTLSGGYLSWETMTFIAKLPKLQTLKLKNHAFVGPKWELTTEVFGCLKQLLIYSTDLVEWEAESTNHFPCLECLVLKSCKVLEEIPYDVLVCVLKRIELHCCSESAEKSVREYQENFGGIEVVIKSDSSQALDEEASVSCGCWR